MSEQPDPNAAPPAPGDGGAGAPASLVVRSPVTGLAVGLETVDDPVFAQGMVGPGTAVDPQRVSGTAVSPAAGQLTTLHPHAFVIVGPGGRGVLVHLGVDTVELHGEGFELLAEQGQEVAAGQPLVRWDPAAVEAGGRSPLCPVVALDASAGQLSGLVTSGAVRAGAGETAEEGDALFSWR